MLKRLDQDMYAEDILKMENDRGSQWSGLQAQLLRWHLIKFLAALDSRFIRFL